MRALISGYLGRCRRPQWSRNWLPQVTAEVGFEDIPKRVSHFGLLANMCAARSVLSRPRVPCSPIHTGLMLALAAGCGNGAGTMQDMWPTRPPWGRLMRPLRLGFAIIAVIPRKLTTGASYAQSSQPRTHASAGVWPSRPSARHPGGLCHPLGASFPFAMMLPSLFYLCLRPCFCNSVPQYVENCFRHDVYLARQCVERQNGLTVIPDVESLICVDWLAW